MERRPVSRAKQIVDLDLKAADPLNLRAVLTAEPYDARAALRTICLLEGPWGSLADEMQQRVAPQERQTLAQHTLRVSDQHERYFSNHTPAELGMSQAVRRLTLLLHDAGKAAALRFGGTSNLQHEYTDELLEHVRPQLPISDAAFARMKAMILTDPLGAYLRLGAKHVPLDETVVELRRAAHEAGMTAPAFMRALTSYYQADLASYTREVGLAHLDSAFASPAGGEPDGLVFDAEAGRLRFSDSNEKKWALLEAAIHSGAGARRAASAAKERRTARSFRRLLAWVTGT